MPDGGMTAALILTTVASTAYTAKTQRDAARDQRRRLDSLDDPFDAQEPLGTPPTAEEAALASNVFEDSRVNRDDLIIRPADDTKRTGLLIP